MSSIPMPRAMTEEAVAEWLHNVAAGSNPGMQVALRARAVLALVREKVREAVVRTNADARDGKWIIADEIVSRVLGDHPQGGHDEGRPVREEAPRG